MTAPAPRDAGVAADAAIASAAPPAATPAVSVAASAPPAPEQAEPAPSAAQHCVDPAPSAAEEDGSVTRSHDDKAVAWVEGSPPDSYLCFDRGGKRKVLLPKDLPRDVDSGIDGSVVGNLVFSRDDRVLFFTTNQWVVTTGAYGIEVATGKSFFITDGQVLEELDHGPFKGRLFASHYRLDEDHPIGSPDYQGRGVVMDIIDWNGKRVRRLPEGEDAQRHIIDGK